MQTLKPGWYQNAVFYEVLVGAFYDSNGDGIGDLRGLREKLDYLQALGVDCLWLLPIYASPMKDGGYDIADYRVINPIFGTLEEFQELLTAVHQRGMHLIMDLVVNHTSDQHPWFQQARTSRESSYHDYYLWSENDRTFSDARIIFVDSEKSNWSWDAACQQYYWHRFYSFQPDLNYDNPQVRREMLEVMDYWLAMGIDGFRVDAVPYLVEREHTNCENLPETHAVLKEFRRFVDEKYPGRILLCEANQWPRDVREYFGNGDEFHLAFHFPLMPRIFMAIEQENFAPIHWALSQTPEIPQNCQWCTFLRNHDELTLEMVSEEERQWMWQHYAPEPEQRMNLGIRRRLAPLLGNNRRKILLAYSLLMTLPGSPVIYYGDELGMGDDILRPDRDGVRTPMQWQNGLNGGFSIATHLLNPSISSLQYSPEMVNAKVEMKQPDSLWSQIQKMIRIRKEVPVLGLGNLEEIDGMPPEMVAYYRFDHLQKIMVIQNLSHHRIYIELKGDPETKKWVDLLGGTLIQNNDGILQVSLDAYEFLWLSQEK